MRFCFLANGAELALPVTPAAYEWTTGKNMETINVSELGDVYLPGGRSRYSGAIDCLLPAQEYPFLEAGATANPQYYLDQLRYWAAEKTPVRFLITDSGVNALVYIESIRESEQDGTGDVYCRIALREYVDLEAREVEATGRTDDAAQAETETDYRTKDGDTPELLDRRAYGGGYSKELLKYNELTRAKFNRSGLLIKLPPREVLRGMK